MFEVLKTGLKWYTKREGSLQSLSISRKPYSTRGGKVRLIKTLKLIA
jgi:hypothetical protein